MESDIKLIKDKTIIEGNYLEVNARDILLDKKERRKISTGLRRALVHDFEDGLTVNWAKDYPGGLSLLGKKIKIDGNNTTIKGNELTVNSKTIILGKDSNNTTIKGNELAVNSKTIINRPTYIDASQFVVKEAISVKDVLIDDLKLMELPTIGDLIRVRLANLGVHLPEGFLQSTPINLPINDVATLDLEDLYERLPGEIQDLIDRRKDLEEQHNASLGLGGSNANPADPVESNWPEEFINGLNRTSLVSIIEELQQEVKSLKAKMLELERR